MSLPEHHGPGGRFRNPWPEASGDDILRRRIARVAWQWATGDHPPDPPRGSLPTASPRIAVPRCPPGELRVTWVGHSTVLVQLPGLNLLTDPVWSERASPLPFAGPRRFVPAIPELGHLPPIDAVLISHDHYDHLDRRTVRRLHQRYGRELTWLTPLGYRTWLARQGVEQIVERDWWQEASLPRGGYRATAVPARHWTRRRPGGTNRRLWAGWVVSALEGDLSLYFAGDSGYGPFFREIGSRLGPFNVQLIPIGAYEPRWFMGAAHLDPEEAVLVYQDLGSQGELVGVHWGTWRLTFEDPLEPPERLRAAWEEEELPPELLRLPRHGETLRFGSPS